VSIVNMHEAKTHLSRLVEALVSGKETEITISRSGRPAVVMKAVGDYRPTRVFGFAKGRFAFDADAFAALDDDVGQVFVAEMERDIGLPGV
jgi:antitoxin (DNA-binding transcriptional repressor) of toxin-antitoxin stability system